MVVKVGVIRITRHLFTVEDYFFVFGLWALAMILVYLLSKYTNMGQDQSDDENSEDDSDSETVAPASTSDGPGQPPVTDPTTRHR